MSCGPEGLFNWVQPMLGFYSGDNFDLYRPDYSVANGTPALVLANQRYRCDPVSRNLPEPFFPDCSYYDILGRRDIIQSGDLLVKSVSDGMTPVVTLLTYGPIKALVGLRTNRICTIIDSVTGTAVYTNVRFDFLREGFPGSSLNRNLQESLRIPQTRAGLYERLNIQRLRMHLVETDLNYYVTDDNGNQVLFQRKWMIEEIDRGGLQIVLTLRNLG